MPSLRFEPSFYYQREVSERLQNPAKLSMLLNMRNSVVLRFDEYAPWIGSAEMTWRWFGTSQYLLGSVAGAFMFEAFVHGKWAQYFIAASICAGISCWLDHYYSKSERGPEIERRAV